MSAIEKPDGPVFVDTTGRRARFLRRLGLLLGAVCLGYAGVLGLAFMGWGTALTPSSLLPFTGGGGTGGGGAEGPGGRLPDSAPPSPTSAASAASAPAAR